ncbi:MAG: cbb3-type cytochrome c oxidase subunit I, partial [Verrucomicrobiota bacterium]
MNCTTDTHLDGCCEETLDRSLQKPLSLIFAFSAIWLLVASLLGALAFWQIKFPGFIDFQRGIQSAHWGWFFELIHEGLNYGRAVAASKSILLYGWLLQGFLGVAIWLSVRLTRKPFCNVGSVFVFGAIALWNLGIFVGLIGILSGEASGFTGFDFPRYAAGMLFVAYTFIAIGVGMRFALKAEGKSTPSEWYLIGAVFWFPWFFAVTCYFVHCKAILGVMPALVHAWYLGGFEVLVLGGLAISSLYYLIPRILGVSLNRCHSAKSAFWFFAFLGAWSGVRHLVGGPLPSWMITSSIVAGALLLIPGTIIANNQMVPLWSNWCKVRENSVLWFLATGGVSFMVWLGLEALSTLRTVSAALNFSY